MVKGVTNNGVHDVKEQYGKLPVVGRGHVVGIQSHSVSGPISLPGNMGQRFVANPGLPSLLPIMMLPKSTNLFSCVIMGVFTYESEIVTAIPPAKMFKACILDGDKLIPRIVPRAFKNVEYIEGNGEPGSIKKITFGEG
ncbi:Bet v I/Major latex protein - like 10 [Theobroma cacao]|nr:Bet v I/Major latex protein - like 10 [Theobroma cacao]